MPAYINDNGTAVEVVPRINVNGSPEECNVYVNDGGTPVLVYSPVQTIEDFEGISSYDEVFRGTFTGSTNITSNAALATSEGSTQGVRCEGFVEMFALPGDHDPGLQSGREASFYFRPVSFDGGDQFHFVLAPQSSESSPPDASYRFEFHMNGGSRLTHINGGRDVLDTENNTSWSSQIYECTFQADSSGVTMSVAGETLSTSNTDYVDNTMGFGFRASGGGSVDYDWLAYT